VIDQLEQKKAYSSEELADFPIYSILTTKSGEEQLLVFSASDRTKKVVTPEQSVTNPDVSQLPTPAQTEPTAAPPTVVVVPSVPPSSDVPPTP
jgi:hypothetical protein